MHPVDERTHPAGARARSAATPPFDRARLAQAIRYLLQLAAEDDAANGPGARHSPVAQYRRVVWPIFGTERMLGRVVDAVLVERGDRESLSRQLRVAAVAGEVADELVNLKESLRGEPAPNEEDETTARRLTRERVQDVFRSRAALEPPAALLDRLLNEALPRDAVGVLKRVEEVVGAELFGAAPGERKLRRAGQDKLEKLRLVLKGDVRTKEAVKRPLQASLLWDHHVFDLEAVLTYVVSAFFPDMSAPALEHVLKGWRLALQAHMVQAASNRAAMGEGKAPLRLPFAGYMPFVQGRRHPSFRSKRRRNGKRDNKTPP